VRRSRQATIDSRLRTMKRALKAGSALAGAEAWPDPNVAGEAANYTLLTANMTSLCRFVMLQKDTAARRELAYVGAAGTADNAALRNREEEEKKNHKAKAAELVQQASAMYNTDFLELCDSAVTVATHHEFGRNRLVTARLHSSCTAASTAAQASTWPRRLAGWQQTTTRSRRRARRREELRPSRGTGTSSCRSST